MLAVLGILSVLCYRTVRTELLLLSEVTPVADGRVWLPLLLVMWFVYVLVAVGPSAWSNVMAVTVMACVVCSMLVMLLGIGGYSSGCVVASLDLYWVLVINGDCVNSGVVNGSSDVRDGGCVGDGGGGDFGEAFGELRLQPAVLG